MGWLASSGQPIREESLGDAGTDGERTGRSGMSSKEISPRQHLETTGAPQAHTTPALRLLAGEHDGFLVVDLDGHGVCVVQGNLRSRFVRESAASHRRHET